jgi:hypothetical protein
MEEEPNMSKKKEERPMRIYEPNPGDNINDIAERMLAITEETEEPIKLSSDGFEIIVTKDSIVPNIIEELRGKMAEVKERYQQSPEGQREAHKSEGQIREAQDKINVLLAQLSGLNFSNQGTVLDWLCAFQEPSDHVSVTTHWQEILKTFAEHGYQPDVNMYGAFDGEDRDNSVRYIIGQALSTLQGDTHHIKLPIHKFTKDWKNKFPS